MIFDFIQVGKKVKPHQLSVGLPSLSRNYTGYSLSEVQAGIGSCKTSASRIFKSSAGWVITILRYFAALVFTDPL